jgi:nicotinate-nucleotide adenylyltransferase
MNIGICGGTFDPFHRGHLDPVLFARQTFAWDRVLYVPAYRQPFKIERTTASGPHRFAMAAIATLDHESLFVSDLELERGAISYTVDTLEQLRERHPDDTLDWVIGDDNLAQLLEWKSIDRIFELANFAVLSRSKVHVVSDALAARVVEPQRRSTRGGIAFAENATVPVSSTEIRKRVSAGEPIDDLVDARVSRYIHHYGLYRKGNRERFD